MITLSRAGGLALAHSECASQEVISEQGGKGDRASSVELSVMFLCPPQSPAFPPFWSECNLYKEERDDSDRHAAKDHICPTGSDGRDHWVHGRNQRCTERAADKVILQTVEKMAESVPQIHVHMP